MFDNRSEMMNMKTTSAQYFSMMHDGDFFHYLSTLFPSTENSEPSDDLEDAFLLDLSPEEYAFGLTAATEIDTEDVDEDMEDFLMTDLERAFSFPETHNFDYQEEGSLEDANDYFDSDVSLLSPDIPENQIQKSSLYSPLERKAQAGKERNDSDDDDNIGKKDFATIAMRMIDPTDRHISPSNSTDLHFTVRLKKYKLKTTPTKIQACKNPSSTNSLALPKSAYGRRLLGISQPSWFRKARACC